MRGFPQSCSAQNCLRKTQERPICDCYHTHAACAELLKVHGDHNTGWGNSAPWRLDHESDYFGECSCCFDYDNKCNFCIGLGLHNWLCRRTALLSMQLSSSGYGCVCQSATWGSYAEMPAAK